VNPLKKRDVLRWVAEHRSLGDRPLMSHERVWQGADGFLVMLFDGPTPAERCDFHINTSPEWFYQLVGEMRCRVIEDGKFRDITVEEGEMFLLPPLVPHLNSRERGSLGIVIHQARLPGAKDSIVWYCEGCCHPLHRVDYLFEDLQAQLPVFIRSFLSNERLRTCAECGWVMPAERGMM
jgi:3-hydroxyanthranilate 3,4-dioxygenase